jgi:predicted MFS family arabinose efflux permease
MASLALRAAEEPQRRRIDIGRELQVLRRRDVIIALLLTVLGAGAMFTVYTYIAPIVRDQMGALAGISHDGLVLCGIGFIDRQRLWRARRRQIGAARSDQRFRGADCADFCCLRR